METKNEKHQKKREDQGLYRPSIVTHTSWEDTEELKLIKKLLRDQHRQIKELADLAGQSGA